jgi:hypothetical protein
MPGDISEILLAHVRKLLFGNYRNRQAFASSGIAGLFPVRKACQNRGFNALLPAKRGKI